MIDSIMLDAALKLAARGLNVFPCKVKDKTPATAHGCKDATKNPLIVRKWWQSNPNWNLAVATGEPSKVFVLDVDGGIGVETLIRLEQQHGELPLTPQSITGGGVQFFFNMPPGMVIKNSARTVGPGLDIRGTGGYVIVPPSIHPSGFRYRWAKNGAQGFADPPQWLLDLIITQPKANGGVRPTPGAGDDEILALLDRKVPMGDGDGRNVAVNKIAGMLLQTGMDEWRALALLQCWNIARCNPPLSDQELVETFASTCATADNKESAHG